MIFMIFQREGENGPERILFPGQAVALPSELFSFFFPTLSRHVGGKESVNQGARVEVRGQPLAISFLFPPPGTQGLNAGPQA